MRETGRTNAFTWLLRRVRAAPSGPPRWRAPATRPPSHVPAAGRTGRATEPSIVQTVRARLAEPPDLVVRAVDLPAVDGAVSAGDRYWVLFLDSIVDATTIAQHIVGPLLRGASPGGTPRASLPAVYVPAVAPVHSIEEATGRLLDGWTVLIDPEERLWAADTAARPGRMVEEPDSESGVRVPREGFNEQIEASMALIRSRLRHPGLRFEEKRFGTRTATRVALVYVEDLINPSILDTVRSRLGRIQIDGVLESGYIEEFIEDDPFSPFPQTLRTERPDVVVGNLLEGHFAILVDGSPFALVGPVVLTQLLGVSEDYYERALLTAASRALRFFALILSLVLPGLYVALLSYDQDLLPTHLFLSIAAAREGVPFPAFVEALIMGLEFEILQEAGLRLPRVVGPAISIVGALVLGQAAISANLVSPAMVIVVAMTAIASFTTPVFSVALAARVMRFFFTIIGAMLGLFGMQAVAVLLLVHLCALRSFGIPYLAPVAPLRLQDWKDVWVRLPWWAMRRRPGWTMPKELIRGRLPRGDHGS